MSRRLTRNTPGRRGQRGLTLVEFMVAIVIGMILVAAIATLIANQSGNRAEVDRAGRMIENGRYAVQTIANDLQMAGYWGEFATQPAVPGAGTVIDPCSTTPADLQAAMGLHVQGYDAPATLPTNVAVCVKNHRAGTDLLVVRRLDPDTSDVEQPAGTFKWEKLKEGQVYVQTGLDGTGVQFAPAVPAQATAVVNDNKALFTAVKKDKVTPATPRKFMVHIYYVSNCSVEVGGSCTNADGGTPIPTLKRVDLGVDSAAPAFSTVTIAEGIENLQLDYGVDTDTDGAADGVDVNGSALDNTGWSNVMSVKVHMLARNSEKSPGFADGKKYVMGTAGEFTPPVADQAYKRHLFVQSVRLVNPTGRRAP